MPLRLFAGCYRPVFAGRRLHDLAIQRKYESEDTRSYDLVRHLIKSEFEPFDRGVKQYY